MAEKKEVVKKHKGTHKAAFPVGMLIIVLAIVGIVSIAVTAIKAIDKSIDRREDYSEYNKLLTPVVLIDPDAFDDITKADMNQLVEISIWSILKSDISPDTYPTTENGLEIPKEDVEKAFVKLFGTERQATHATVLGYGYEFTYDEATGKYFIPLTSVTPIYTPKVVEKEETAGTIVLTVACLNASAWEQNENGEMVEPTPDKYIKVTLRAKNGGYYISAIQNTTTPEIATSVDIPTQESTTSDELIENIETTEPSSEEESSTDEASTEDGTTQENISNP